jgi:hypothetical protein
MLAYSSVENIGIISMGLAGILDEVHRGDFVILGLSEPQRVGTIACSKD